jgi:hypothetical protein
LETDENRIIEFPSIQQKLCPGSHYKLKALATKFTNQKQRQKRPSSRVKDQPISQATYYSMMSYHRNTKSPTAGQDNDVQMSNTIDIYHPRTWEQLEGQDSPSAMQTAIVSRD